jgi:hypothetical protein
MVILDTYELAVVTAANSDLNEVHRPMVRIISDQGGSITYPGFLANLADRDGAGTSLRTIIKVTDPDKYGVRVSDYFL